MRELMAPIIAKKGDCRILDIGGTHEYWAAMLSKSDDDLPIEITLVNLESRAGEGHDPRFTSVVGDARDLSQYPNDSFDLVHSNSVIEHVGRWSDMRAMANEVRRLAPHYFVQTPNFWFPIEPHFRTAFFHWLPEQLRMRLIMMRGLGFHPKGLTVDDAMTSVESARCLNRRQFAALFPDAEIVREKFLGVTKSFIAVR